MRWAKLTAIVFLWGFFLCFIAFVHLWISVLRLPHRWEIISRLTRSLTFLLSRILNLKVTVVGDAGQLERGGYVVISNHVSYLDGFVLGSIFSLVFVSKREVKKWPVIGLWTTLCGTIFINRQRKNQLPSLIAEITKKLRDEVNVLLFPEGRSTNGERMLAAPLRNRSIIVPVTLTYKSVDDKPVSAANRDLIYWYGDGDADFVPHFWKLLSLGSIEVIVTIQPKIECFRYADNSAGRKKLAMDCYNRVLGRPVEPGPSLEEDEDSEEESTTLLPS